MIKIIRGFQRLGMLGALLALCLCMSAISAGAAEPKENKQTPQKDPTEVKPAQEKDSSKDAETSDVLQVGDEVRVILGGLQEFQDKAPVDQKVKDDGTITVNLLGSLKVGTVKAVGKTPAQLEKDIVAMYVPRYYKRLSVTVVAGNRWYYVTGEVRKPDRFPFMGELTVTKAIASAGGFTDFAKKAKVQLTRNNGTTLFVDCDEAKKDPKLDPAVLPGDKIDVPKRFF